MIKQMRQEFADTMLEVGQKDPNLIVRALAISEFFKIVSSNKQPEKSSCFLRFTCALNIFETVSL